MLPAARVVRRRPAVVVQLGAGQQQPQHPYRAVLFVGQRGQAFGAPQPQAFVPAVLARLREGPRPAAGGRGLRPAGVDAVAQGGGQRGTGCGAQQVVELLAPFGAPGEPAPRAPRRVAVPLLLRRPPRGEQRGEPGVAVPPGPRRPGPAQAQHRRAHDLVVAGATGARGHERQGAQPGVHIGRVGRGARCRPGTGRVGRGPERRPREARRRPRTQRRPRDVLVQPPGQGAGECGRAQGRVAFPFQEAFDGGGAGVVHLVRGGGPGPGEGGDEHGQPPGQPQHLGDDRFVGDALGGEQPARLRVGERPERQIGDEVLGPVPVRGVQTALSGEGEDDVVRQRGPVGAGDQFVQPAVEVGAVRS